MLTIRTKNINLKLVFKRRRSGGICTCYICNIYLHWKKCVHTIICMCFQIRQNIHYSIKPGKIGETIHKHKNLGNFSYNIISFLIQSKLKNNLKFGHGLMVVTTQTSSNGYSLWTLPDGWYDNLITMSSARYINSCKERPLTSHLKQKPNQPTVCIKKALGQL